MFCFAKQKLLITSDNNEYPVTAFIQKPPPKFFLRYASEKLRILVTLCEILFKIFMENEKYFSQHIEQPEHEPKMYNIRFDESHFGDCEIDPEAVRIQAERGSSWIPEAINEWWVQICSENNLDPENKRLDRILLHLIEVARNAFEKVGSGEIKVIFEQKGITFIVSDDGYGFKNPNEDMLPNHGLDLAKKFANEFIIETNGRKFEKVKGKRKLVETKDTSVQQGSKITFIKNFE